MNPLLVMSVIGLWFLALFHAAHIDQLDARIKALETQLAAHK